jgi:hypothetical protein
MFGLRSYPMGLRTDIPREATYTEGYIVINGRLTRKQKDSEMIRFRLEEPIVYKHREASTSTSGAGAGAASGSSGDTVPPFAPRGAVFGGSAPSQFPAASGTTISSGFGAAAGVKRTASSEADRAASVDPERPIREKINMGIELVKQNKYQEAAERLSEALAMKPTSTQLLSRALVVRAAAYLKLGKYDECVQDTVTAERSGVLVYQIFEYRARCLEGANRVPEAIRAYQRYMVAVEPSKGVGKGIYLNDL